MLTDRPEEQLVLFKEIITKKLTVREAESMSRRVATDKIRNKGKYLDPAIMEMEKNFTETLGTRVRIERVKEGGTVVIDFFSPDDLRALLEKLANGGKAIQQSEKGTIELLNKGTTETMQAGKPTVADSNLIDDRAPADVEKQENEEIYSLKDFSL
jgi:hypothetical protein